MNSIPTSGISRAQIFQQLESMRREDGNWRSGKIWAYNFDAGREAEEVAKEAFLSFLSVNALDPTVFPSVQQLETRLVEMAASHLGGGPETSGTFTSGGTESIMLAVKTARDYFRAKRPDITEPEILLPVTGHAAFHKAANYLGLKVVPVDVDPTTMKADVGAAKAALTPNTILIVGSATSYGPGVIDPIGELAALAAENGILMHVDACIGGFLLPYFRRLGSEVPAFDLSVPGVTSISMDFHKYGYAPKGASVVLYQSKELRRHQIFACARWTGYTVVNAAVQSSKSGGPLAAAWAVLNFLGDEGYLKLAERIRNATMALIEGIEEIDGLRLLVRPQMSLIAFTSDEFDIFHVIDEMTARGWYVQPQLSFGAPQRAAHLSVSPNHDQVVDAFLADLRESVAAARAIEPSELGSAIQDFFASVPAGQLDPEMFPRLLEMAGIQGGQLPQRMADINGLLCDLPPEVNEGLLKAFVNQLFR